MNNNYLESLPHDEREQIVDLYSQVIEKEISPNQFLNRVKEIIGQDGLNQLLSKAQENEIKTEELHDVVQYAGVDLHEEQDNIIDDYENENDSNSDDPFSSMDSLLNVDMFMDFVARILANKKMKLSEDAFYTLFMVLRRKLIDLVEKVINASKVRVDFERNGRVIEIQNDLRRQLWCLEQNEQKSMDNLKFKKETDENRKKVKRNIQEREDLVIKKRMSNNIALAALGGSQKLWMSMGDSTHKEMETPLQSLYSPYDEKEHERKVKDRCLTMQDFLYVLEHDKRYNKSIFTIQQYYL